MTSAFPTNSHKAKAENTRPDAEAREKIKPIVVSPVTRRRKPLGKRISEVFTGGDTRGVFSYVLLDVLVPAAKDMVSDAVSQGVERMLFGEVRSRRSSARDRPNNGYVSYNRFSGSRPDPREEQRSISRRARSQHNFDDIVLGTQAEATEVVDALFELVGTYGVAKVADLYDLVGVTSVFTDEKWGWSDIRGIGSTRVRDGYLLDLPRPEPLD